MNNKWKRTLALLLMLALMFTLPLATAWAEGEDGGDVTEAPAADDAAGGGDDAITGTLTAKVADDYAYKDDLEASDVKIDLYQVAVAKKDPTFVSYVYDVVDGFGLTAESLDTYEKLAALDSDAWDAMAQTAWDTVLGGSAPDAAVTGAALGAASDVEGGIYLVVAHGISDNVADYVKEITVTEGDTTVTRKVTMAQSSEYIYTFNPVLIAVPNSPNYNTDLGDWEFDVTAILKPGERELRMTEVTIVKDLTAMNLSAQFAGQTATFAFKVTYELKDEDGSIVASGTRVAGLSFTGADVKAATVYNIPVGASVTVTEEYGGAAYTLVASEHTSFIASDDISENIAEFTNSPPETPPFDSGYGIENNYVMEGGSMIYGGQNGSSGGNDEK